MNGRKTILGLLTPLVAAASAWLTASVAKYGVHLDQSGVNAALVTGASAAIAVMLKLIHDVETDVDRELKKTVPPGDDELIAGVLNAMEPQLRLAAIAAVQSEISNLTHNIQMTPPLGPASSTPQVTAGTAAVPAEAAIGAPAPDPDEASLPSAPRDEASLPSTPRDEASVPSAQPDVATAPPAEPAEPREPAPATAGGRAATNGTSMAEVASPAARRPGVPPQG